MGDGPIDPSGISFPSYGTDPMALAKLQGKNQQALAKLQGSLQKSLAKQQAKYQLQLQQAQAASSMALQTEQQQYESPFQTAQLIGYLNGHITLPGQQVADQEAQFGETLHLQQAAQANQVAQFNQSFGLQQQTENFNEQMEQINSQLQQKQYELQKAIQEGNLALAQKTEADETNLKQQAQDLQNQQFATQSTGMYNGQLTQAAIAQRAQLAMQQGQLTGVYIDPTTGQQMTTEQAAEFAKNLALQQTGVMGVDANGNLTEAARAARANEALQYAQTAAQLQANPGDYFQSAAFMRNAQGTGVPGLLAQYNAGGLGANQGFTSAKTGLPPTGSMDQIAGGVPAAQPTSQQLFNVGVMEVMKENPGMSMADATSWMQQNGANAQQIIQNGIASGYLGAAATPGTGPMVYGASADQTAPSGSMAQAQAAAQGAPVAFTNSMNQPMPTVAQAQGAQGGGAGVAPSFFGDLASQSAAASAAVAAQGGDLAQQRLAGYQPIFQSGAQKLAPSFFANMMPTESKLFNSAANASGINPDDFREAAKRAQLQTNVSANLV